MNNRLNLSKVVLVLALFIGLVGLWRQPATVQPQAQASGPRTSAVAQLGGQGDQGGQSGQHGQHGPHTNVNWNA